MADGHSFNNISLSGRGGTNPGLLKINSGGIQWKKQGGGKAVEVDESDIVGLSWMKVPRTNQLGVKTKDGLYYKFIGFRDQDVASLTSFFQSAFGKTPEEKQLSVSGRNWGEVDLNGNNLTFLVGGKQAFEVSLADVSQTQLQGKNDVLLEFHVDDTAGANENPGLLKINSGGIQWKKQGGGKAVEVDESDIVGLSWMKVPRTNQLGVKTKDGLYYKFIGFRDQDVASLTSFFQSAFGKTPEEKQLSVSGRNWGEVDLNGNNLTFLVGGKQAFEVSLADVSQTQLQGKNDVLLEFHLSRLSSLVSRLIEEATADGHSFNNISLSGRGGTKQGGGKAVEVDESDIVGLSWMKVPRTNQLGVKTKDGLYYKFSGFRDQDVASLTSFFQSAFGKTPEEKQLSVSGRNWGEVDLNGNNLTFLVGGKQAFEVSLADVSQTQLQGKNDVLLEFHVDDTAGANEIHHKPA
ncbi:hypothetical protein F2Q68_00036557 [Brassica cretica]|uniref:FACT complex subunit SSRP1 n=1 Tax=Brassica cretica TaxID=69181 RepID=A0A8S9HA86_BRACR|nr:hypothetical protein F2Q68_00036557 [Brassica cretica]